MPCDEESTTASREIAINRLICKFSHCLCTADDVECVQALSFHTQFSCGHIV